MTTATAPAIATGSAQDENAGPAMRAQADPSTTFIVPDMHCGGCLRKVETTLEALAVTAKARANLSQKSVRVIWADAAGDADAATGEAVDTVLAALRAAGYDAHTADAPGKSETRDREHMRYLLRATAVAGFAAANIMLLSVSIWSGADGSTRDLFHWISALIATPAVAYAGMPFFGSAFKALKARRLNMDVPISLAVILAYAMSLIETVNHGAHAYFDAATTLLFFLLVGRTLDHAMRNRARGAITRLAGLMPDKVIRLQTAGAHEQVNVGDVAPGDVLLVKAGDRVPVDGTVIEGASDLDVSLVTGESLPTPVMTGAQVRAGVLNLTGVLQIRAIAGAQGSFLSQITQLMQAAEVSRSTYRRLADRAASLYAPLVHLVAAATFLGWLSATGDARLSLYTAIAVLIITCPCALGLAVPIVQVVAVGRLFENGIMVKDGGALERLGEIDAVLFDKTGTLTRGTPQVVSADLVTGRSAVYAALMAAQSRHPLARAIAAHLGPIGEDAPILQDAKDVPGQGVEGVIAGNRVRLGKPSWCRALGRERDQSRRSEEEEIGEDDDAMRVDLSVAGDRYATFRLYDAIRTTAPAVIEELRAHDLPVAILSGDRATSVDAVAKKLGVSTAYAGLLPDEKVAHIQNLRDDGRRVLMVGDGLNDAPALRAAWVSMAPGSAADIGRVAADIIYMHNNPQATITALKVARRMRRLIFQNFALAIAYNLIAVPIAVAGLATPLVAAIAMSSSSILVIANALRLKGVSLAKPERLPFPALNA